MIVGKIAILKARRTTKTRLSLQVGSVAEEEVLAVVEDVVPVVAAEQTQVVVEDLEQVRVIVLVDASKVEQRSEAVTTAVINGI
ncbi:unnamed protein product [Phytophthora lilii]|uniref:Unnamed protein product n=1 Tax=Phytophthora lilii TaxID=2077276 RepID=A0A9W6TQY8_9STRA|nr:unnamed protein product [Phytophthora lilii]